MAGERPDPPGNWPTVPVLDHLTALLADRDKYFEQRFTDKERRDEQRFVDKDIRDQQRFDAQSEAIAAALASAKEASEKVAVATETRFASVNEFRGALTDQTARLVPRAEFVAVVDRLQERIQELSQRANKTEGRSTGLNAGWGYLVGAVGAVGAIVAIFASRG